MGVLQDDLVLSTELTMLVSHRKEIRKETQTLTIFVCSVFNLNNKNVNILIARELSGYTHPAASCGIEISRSFLVNSCR